MRGLPEGAALMTDWFHIQLGDALDDWFEAVGVIVVTLIAIGAARTVLLSGRTHRRWGYLARLAPAAVNLISAIGFKLFIEVAPLNATLENISFTPSTSSWSSLCWRSSAAPLSSRSNGARPASSTRKRCNSMASSRC